VPGAAVNLTDVILLVPKATNPLAPGRTMAFTGPTGVAAALAGTQISATTAAQLNSAFSQTTKRPNVIYVGNVDLVGAETYGAAYTIIKGLIGSSFFFICDQSNDKTQQESISVLIEAEDFEHFYSAQVLDTQWYGAVYPVNYALFTGREKTATFWHETATVAQALAFTAERGAYNPDTELSASWMGKLTSVAAPTALTAAQELLMKGYYVNLGKAFGTDANFVRHGTNCNNRSIDHIVTAAWLRAAMKVSNAQLVASYAARGEKLTVDAKGGNTVLASNMAVVLRGLGLGHFQKYTDPLTGVQYPKGSYSLDLPNKRITCNITAYFSDQVREIVINNYLNEAV